MGFRFVVVGTIDPDARRELEAFGGGSEVRGPFDPEEAARIVLGGAADAIVMAPQWRPKPSPHSFQHLLDREFARAVRYRHPLVLLSLEVDGLAAMRETHGDAATGNYLSQLETALRRSLREMDHLARLDDDTFGVLLPETGIAGAVNAAERLRGLASRLLAKPADSGDRRGIPLKATVSIGLAESPAEGIVTSHDLHRRSTEARSRAAEGGGDRVAV